MENIKNLKNQILQGNCLDVMKYIPDKSIDMILCDLPYGTTRNKWDSVIDLNLLWKEYKRIIKEKGAIVLTGQDKFSAKLMLSNEDWHRYNLIWDKKLISGFLNANRMPLRVHEDILVFYNKLPTYNPQKVRGNKNHSMGSMKTDVNRNYGKHGKVDNGKLLGEMKHPKSIISFQKPHPSKCLHPTEKPVELGRWLIRTFTNPGDLILDNTCGVGSFLVSAGEEKRDFIGIELDNGYCKIARERTSQFK